MDIAEELMMFSRELPSPGPDTECCRLICCRSVGGGVVGGASREEREREMPSARATLCLLSGRPLLASFGEDTADNIIIIQRRVHHYHYYTIALGHTHACIYMYIIIAHIHVG